MRRFVTWYLLSASLALSTDARGEEPPPVVRVDLKATISGQEPDGSFRIEYGKDQGVVDRGTGTVYRLQQDGDPVRVGTLTVELVQQNRAWARVVPDDPSVPVRIGDVLEVPADVRPDVTRGVVFDVVRDDIQILDLDARTPLVGWGDVYADQDHTDWDGALATYVAQEVREHPGRIARRAGNDPPSGRFSASPSLRKALKATTPDDVLDMLWWFEDSHDALIGHGYSFPYSYGIWANLGGPTSPLEIAHAAMALDADARTAYLANHRKDILDGSMFGSWYNETRRLASLTRWSDADALVALMKDAAGALADEGGEYWAWLSAAEVARDEGRYDDAIAAYREATSHLHDDPANVRYDLQAMARAAKASGHTDDAIAFDQELLAHPEVHEADTVPETWIAIGDTYRDARRYSEAIDAYQKAIDLYSQPFVRERVATIERAISWVDSDDGRYADALEHDQRALKAAQTGPDDGVTARAYDRICADYWSLGDYPKALDACQKEHDAWVAAKDDLEAMTSYDDQARLLWNMGRYDEAMALDQQTLKFNQDRYVPTAIADTLDEMAGLLRAKGAHADAIATCDQRIAVLEPIGDEAALADAHADKASSLVATGRPADAAAEYAVALDLAEKAGDQGKEAEILEGWGASFLQQHDVPGATEKLEKALAIRRSTSDREGEANSLITLSGVYEVAGRHEEAMKAADDALVIAKALPSKKLEAQATAMRAGVLIATGHAQDAIAAYRRELEICDQMQDPTLRGATLISIGQTLHVMSDEQGAIASYEEAIAIGTKIGNDGLRAAAETELAWALLYVFDFDRARTLLDDAEAVYTKLGNRTGIADVETNRAELYLDTGDLGAAIAEHEKAIVIRKEQKDEWGLIRNEANEAGVYVTMGDYARALAVYEGMVPRARALGFLEALVVTEQQISWCRAHTGDAEGALTWARAALDDAKIYDTPQRIAESEYVLGSALRRHGDLDEAQKVLVASRDLSKSQGMLSPLIASERELGIVQYLKKDYPAARASLGDAAKLARTNAAPNSLWEPLFWLGRAERDAGNKTAAITAYQESVDTLEKIKASITTGKDDLAAFAADRGDVYRELVDLLMQAKREDDAFRVLAQMKSQELDQLTRGIQQPVVASSKDEQQALDDVASMRAEERDLEKKLRDELAKPAKSQRADLVADWRKQLDAVQLRFQDYSRKLEKDHPELVQKLQIAPPSFFKLQADLKKNEAFVEPVVLPDRVVVFVVRGGEAPLLYRETKVPESQVTDLVRQMRERLAQPSVPWDTVRGVRVAASASMAATGGGDPTAPAKGLYDLVIAPIKDDLVGIDTLIASPSGRLRYVPFAALWTGDHYLVQDYRLAVLTQSGALAEHVPLQKGAPLLAFGNPDGSLPGAESEVRTLGDVWGKKATEAFYGPDATKDRLRQAVAGHAILHLATHGVLLNDAPEDSYILLAGQGDAGKLTFREIPLLPLQGVDLAVLSACQTAVGDHGEGTEIAGLAYQFEMRGAASVIASLWSVDDQSTSALMTGLYTNLQKPDEAKADALREAQLALLADPKTSHPYYWAPFVLIGDWR